MMRCYTTGKGTSAALRTLAAIDDITLLPVGTRRANLHGIAKYIGIRISYEKLDSGIIRVRRVG